jgi:phage terminase small subunit
MTDDDIASAIAEAQAARGKRTEVTQDRVVLELARIAFGDSRRVMSWGPGGVTLRPSAELSDEDAAIVAEASQTVTEHGGTVRLKVCDKIGALRLLGQHLGMLGEGKVAVTVANAPAAAELQTVLLAVLGKHPEAKRAVVAALEAMANDVKPEHVN